MKLSTSVGVVGARSLLANVHVNVESCDVRLAQSKSARLRTSTAQHWAVREPEQRLAWRCSTTGAAMAATAKARMAVNCMLIVCLVGGVMESDWKFVNEGED